jgi:hypothetical protein
MLCGRLLEVVLVACSTGRRTLRQKTIKRLDTVGSGFPSRRWARALVCGHESSNRLAQNDWIWLANGSLRLTDGWRLQAHGTTAPGSEAPAGATGQADGADGWWGMGQPPLPGRGWRCTPLYLEGRL